MYLFVLALHVVVCFVLVLVIILQPGKGGDAAGGLGGGAAAAIFGPQGPTNLLQQITSASAVVFMVTSISLAYYSSRELLNNADVDAGIRALEEKKKAKENEEPVVIPLPAEGVGEPPAGSAPDGAAPPAGAAPTP